jgi:hypothetical protein
MPGISGSESPLATAGTLDSIPIDQASEKSRIILRWVDAHNACDTDGMLACSTPEIEFHSLQLVGGASDVYVGAEGLHLWAEESRRARANHTLELAELTETADRQVVAIGSAEVPGRGGSLEFFGTYEVADGLIAHAHHYVGDPWTLRALS